MQADSANHLARLRAELAHEIAHGLTSLRSTVAECVEMVARQRLGQEPVPIEELDEHLRVIRYEVESELFQSLNVLAVLSPERLTGIGRAEIRVVDIWDTVREMSEMYRERADARGIGWQMPDTVPSERSPHIRVEVNILRGIVHNLLSNAIKYSYSSGDMSERYIRLWWRRHNKEGTAWALGCQNYGVGILPEELSMVCEPGYRGKLAMEDRTLGSGLGLAVIRQGMQRHGGHVIIDSKELPGEAFLTTVTLVFPIQGIVHAGA